MPITLKNFLLPVKLTPNVKYRLYSFVSDHCFISCYFPIYKSDHQMKTEDTSGKFNSSRGTWGIKVWEPLTYEIESYDVFKINN